MGLREDIRTEIDKMAIIDTHEHLFTEAERLRDGIDFGDFMTQYAGSDYITSGMSQGEMDCLTDRKMPVQKRWQILEPYWEQCRNTAHCRGLLLSARDLFGLEDINSKTYNMLAERLSQYNRKGWFEKIFKEKCNIELAIHDRDQSEMKDKIPDPRFFVSVNRMDNFIMIETSDDVVQAQRKYDTSICCLNDFLKALDKAFAQAKAQGAVGIKSGLAYKRILKYDKVSYQDAERGFNQILNKEDDVDEKVIFDKIKPLQDFMMHEVTKRCVEHKLPFQIHTGLQAGNWNNITDSNPTHLINLFLEYRQAKFDLFHIGYPYWSEMAVLGKTFPNVYIDMCWAHVICPSVARRALSEWIETVPSNKILGFGGDYGLVEAMYGHLKFARDNIARVLTEKIQEGYFLEGDAINLARRILRDNAWELYIKG